MVVDDDPDDIALFLEAAEEIDPMMLCHHAENGMEALTLLESSDIQPDIIFVDLNMPILNGSEFIRAVRENKAYNDIKLYLYSTIDLNKNIPALDAADGFFRKPITYPALRHKIAEVLHNCFSKTV